jgi:hypothetical protein
MRLPTVLEGKTRARLLGVLAVLAMMAPVIWALSARVPNFVETPLTPERGDRIAVPIELSYLSYPGSSGPHVARMNLHLGNLEVLVHRRTIEILVANYQTRPRLESAELSVEGTECRFETPPRADWPNNATLPFLRKRGCAPLQGTPTGRLELTVRFTGAGRVGLWTYRPLESPTDQNVIYLPDPSWSDLGLQVELRGNYVDWAGLSRYRRADLLSYMWNVDESSTWVWISIALALALLVLGALGVSPRPEGGTTLSRALRLAGTGFLWSAGLSLLYVVVVPPFQAPDEPSHFLGYDLVAGNQKLQDETARWGWVTHFERLRGHPEERFRPSDVGQPYFVSWQLVSPVGFGRSSVTVPLWRWLSGLLEDLSASRQLLILRLINAGVFSLAIAASVGMIGMFAAARRPESAIALFLLVPTLPFFATYVSNYAPGVAAYVLIAAACLILFLDGPRAQFAGIPLGLGLALAIASTRSALPMLVLASIVAGNRLMLGSRDKGFLPAAIFWSGMCAGTIALKWFHTEQYAQGIMSDLARIAPRTSAVVSFAMPHPLLVAVAGVAAIALLEWVGVMLHRGRAGRVRPVVARAIGPACLVGMVIVAGNLTASLFLPLPHLTSAAGASSITVTTYVLQAVAIAATPFRVTHPDFLMSTTFWGAFGWVDTILPDVVLALLSLSSAFATVVMLRQLSITKDVRRFCWLTALVLAFFATLAVYAAAVFWSAPDLHGRYLIGPYLVFVVTAWSPALCVEDGGTVSTTTASDWMARAAWLVLGVGHASALVTILARYF